MRGLGTWRCSCSRKPSKTRSSNSAVPAADGRDVTGLVHLTPLDPRYPPRLRSLPDPPGSITVSGGALDSSRAVAIVGSRQAVPGALRFARDLARELTKAGVVVVSGGAEGVDRAAHEGALGTGGRTWAIAGTGHERCFPPGHAGLFAVIGRGPGAMVWPFAPGYQRRSGFLLRNRVLVALSDAVVVVQAGLRSGALHAASWAKKLGRPLWVVPAAPWMSEFDGSRQLLDAGARPLRSIDVLLGALGLAGPPGPPPTPTPPGARFVAPSHPLSEPAAAVLTALSTGASHADAIAALAHLTAQATAATLLTLALEDVVVEGPPGFFRRRDNLNR
jgi:DNA processing protein